MTTEYGRLVNFDNMLDFFGTLPSLPDEFADKSGE
jgi:hypothetical protein